MGKTGRSGRGSLEETRRLFLDLAEAEFTTHGYSQASTSRIVAASGMARGSLYYHFKDKQDLFRAVYIRMMERVSADLAGTVRLIDDPWKAFLTGCYEYLQICANPAQSRIFLVESQAALPYSERHAVISETIRPVLTESLTRIMDRGYFKGQNKDMMSLFIFGTLGESGRVINVMPDREKMMQHYFNTFRWAMEKIA